MRYTEIAIWCPLALAETVSWHLLELGMSGVVVSEIPASAPRPELIAVKAYRPGDPEDQASWLAETRIRLDQAAIALETSPFRIETRSVAEEDWADSWKRYWHVMPVGERLVVKPSWEPYEPKPQDLVIELDPKQAFGTGTHATTQLCMRGLEQALRPGDRVFDVGSGSGILALSALLLGASRVWACDTDPVAVASTRENLAINHQAGRCEVFEGGIETLEGESDLLVVNILAEVIVEIADEIARRVRPGGRVLASGIIRAREAMVREAFLRTGLRVGESAYQGDWVLVSAERP